ncbi:unnamed protein product [Coffea canephora]|uniref:Uncharacterized protein n=1 Tax=Coffea canephora TaxID=49390 RepID=A0A068UIA4_COFCA|nr:unnamed protein product [Coffea canephora]
MEVPCVREASKACSSCAQILVFACLKPLFPLPSLLELPPLPSKISFLQFVPQSDQTPRLLITNLSLH